MHLACISFPERSVPIRPQAGNTFVNVTAFGASPKACICLMSPIAANSWLFWAKLATMAFHVTTFLILILSNIPEASAEFPDFAYMSISEFNIKRSESSPFLILSP
uniref:Uncharacterized protein n=1 Tax=Opuntia streptacantha TaxID=393608 RepID=A0A7C9ARB2_OPUST